MKRCLNCRMTYSKELSECPHCGYKPRSKAARIKLEEMIRMATTPILVIWAVTFVVWPCSMRWSLA